MAAENSVLDFETPKISLHFNVDRRRVLFSDTFYTFYPATEIDTKKHFVCKNYPKKTLNATYGIDDLRREIEVLYHLSGQENVAQIMNVYESSREVNIILDLFEVDEPSPWQLLQNRSHSEPEAAILISIIVGVVQACHSMGVICRTLSHKTFRFAEQDGLLLRATAVDFAFARFFKPGDPPFRGSPGSKVYMAPEIRTHHYGPQADVWAAGVLLYRLLGGVPPFYSDDDTDEDIIADEGNSELYKKYQNINFGAELWHSISEDAKYLIRGMLWAFPNIRLKSQDILDHRWFSVHGVDPSKALDTVLPRLRQFSKMNKLKKMALGVIAFGLKRVEIAGLEECFHAINTSNNGEITCDELKAGLQVDFEEARAIMDAADLDENGTIDYQEFIAATLPHNKLENDEHLLTAFEYFAKERSGFITLEKLQETCPNMSHVLLQNIIKEVSRDKDGCISYSEFVDTMQEV